MVALKKLFLCLFFGYSCLLSVHASTVSDALFPLYRVTITKGTRQQCWISSSLRLEEIAQRSEKPPFYIPQCIKGKGQWEVKEEEVGYDHPFYKVPLSEFAASRERWGNPKMAEKRVNTRIDLAEVNPREFTMVLIPDLKAKKGIKRVPMNALLDEGLKFYLKGWYDVNEETKKWAFFYDNSLAFDTHHGLMADLLRPVVLGGPLTLSKDEKQDIYYLEVSGRSSKRILPWKAPPEGPKFYDLGATVKWAKEGSEQKVAIIYWDALNERFEAKRLTDWPVLEVSVTITWQQKNSAPKFPTREFSSKQLVREVKEALANQVKTANGGNDPWFAVAKQRLYIGGANGVLLDDNATLEFYSKGGATLDLYLVLEPETKQNEEEEQTPQQATNPSATREKKRWFVLPTLLGSGGLLARWYSKKKAEAKEKATEKQKVKKKKNINKKGREKGEATVRARSSLT